MASQNLNIKVKLDFDETSLKNLNLGTVRVDPDVNHFKSKLRSALNGNFKITPKINTKGISNQLNNIKNDMREFRNTAKDPIKINFDVDKDVLSDLAVVSRQLEKIHRDDWNVYAALTQKQCNMYILLLLYYCYTVILCKYIATTCEYKDL
ncbi:hypothetical protein CP360_06145 [Lactobacillus sp. UMNPBX9]|nr:hypothetical protein CP360_06145 [Lactobacillus sp. UMNPBX9]